MRVFSVEYRYCCCLAARLKNIFEDFLMALGYSTAEIVND